MVTRYFDGRLTSKIYNIEVKRRKEKGDPINALKVIGRSSNGAELEHMFCALQNGYLLMMVKCTTQLNIAAIDDTEGPYISSGICELYAGMLKSGNYEGIISDLMKASEKGKKVTKDPYEAMGITEEDKEGISKVLRESLDEALAEMKKRSHESLRDDPIRLVSKDNIFSN